MFAFRSLRHRIAWIACWAVLVGALAPAVSQCLAAVRQQPVWTDICSAGSLASVPSKPTDRSPAGAHGGAPCAYCLTHAGSFGLPPTHWQVTLPTTAGIDVRPPTDAHPAWVAVVRAAQPRGPPALA